jgi:hypothetical protein
VHGESADDAKCGKQANSTTTQLMLLVLVCVQARDIRTAWATFTTTVMRPRARMREARCARGLFAASY